MHRNRRTGSSRVCSRLGLLALVAGLATPVLASPAQSAVTPGVTIGDVTVTEGDIGTKPARLTVNVSSPLAADTIITFTTADETATSGADYLRRASTVRIRAGRSFTTIALRTISDTAIEGDETFTVTLTDSGGIPIADGTGAVTIRDDDLGTTGRLAIGDATVSEGDVGLIPLRFTVTLDAPSATDVTARFAVVGGSATLGVDAVVRMAAFRIRAGRTSAVLTVKEVGDIELESTEQFTVVLSSVVGATPTDDTGVGTIVDDDTPLIAAPGAPTLTSAVAGPANGMLVVAWDPPADDGGSVVTRYDLEIDRPAGLIIGSYTSTAVNIVCGSPGITCAMRVRAINTVGAGPWSDPLSGTTWRAPSAVDLTVTGGNQSTRASWSAPTDIGDFPVLDYRIERSADGTTFSFVSYTDVRATTVSCPGERSTCWVRVRARNAAGLGPASEASATTWARPGAPTLVSARRAGTLVGLGWTAPADDGGAAIFDYTGERTLDGGTTWNPVGSVQFVLSSCPIGTTCGFRVSALNIVGSSTASNVLFVGP